MHVTELTDATLPRHVADARTPLLVVFHSRASRPSRTMLPVLSELGEDYENLLEFALAEAERCPEALDRYGILSLPTYLVFRQGRLMDRFIGSLTKETLIERLEDSLQKVIA